MFCFSLSTIKIIVIIKQPFMDHGFTDQLHASRATFQPGTPRGTSPELIRFMTSVRLVTSP